jgi:hypothetical protein
LLCLVAALSATLLVAVRKAATPSLAMSQQIAVPLYIDPVADRPAWEQLAGSSPGSIGFVVANVLNGPGLGMDPAWASAMSHEHAAGVKVLGYVDTGYFGRTGRTTRVGSATVAGWTAQAEQDVNSWYSFYGPYLSGIFFDDAQDACGPSSGSDSWADLYAQLTAYVKGAHPGAMTVANPGSPVPQCYEGVADVLVTFEGSYSAYTRSYVGLSWSPAGPQKIWHIVYDVPSAPDMESVVALSKARGAGYVYVTSATLPNPYDTLPPYWDGEQAQLATLSEPVLGHAPAVLRGRGRSGP